MQIRTIDYSFSQDSQSNEDENFSDPDRQRSFSKLLHKRQKKTDDEPIPTDSIFELPLNNYTVFARKESDAYGGTVGVKVLQEVGSVYQSKDIYIKRVDLHSLNVRLMIGSMTGLEIQASIQAGNIKLLLKAANEKHRKYLQERLADLEGKINSQGRYRVEIYLEEGHGLQQRD